MKKVLIIALMSSCMPNSFGMNGKQRAIDLSGGGLNAHKSAWNNTVISVNIPENLSEQVHITGPLVGHSDLALVEQV